MWTLRPAITVLGILLLAGPETSADDPEDSPTQQPPPIVVVSAGASTDELAHVEWALDRLDLAGIRIPDPRIEFFDDYASCNMCEGLMRMKDGAIIVLQCGRTAAQIRRNLLHELTHAWDLGTDELDDRQRRQFLAMRASTPGTTRPSSGRAVE